MTNVLSILGEEGDLTTATTLDAAKISYSHWGIWNENI